MSYLLILTATIQPKGMTHLVLVDPSQRLHQYAESLRRWLAVDDPALNSILFLENSGADLSSLHSLVANENRYGKEVEIIGQDLNEYPRELGKGYGEFLMLDSGIARSKLAKTHENHAKVTGRLGVRNLGRIIRALPPQYDFAGDVWTKRGKESMLDSRLLLWSRDFYQEHIVDLYKKMDDETRRFAEIVLLERMLDLPDHRFISCLPVQPSWIGVSGTHGFDYGDWTQRMRYPLRQVVRKFKRAMGLPNLQRLRAQRSAAEPAARSVPTLTSRPR